MRYSQIPRSGPEPGGPASVPSPVSCLSSPFLTEREPARLSRTLGDIGLLPSLRLGLCCPSAWNLRPQLCPCCRSVCYTWSPQGTVPGHQPQVKTKEHLSGQCSPPQVPAVAVGVPVVTSPEWACASQRPCTGWLWWVLWPLGRGARDGVHSRPASWTLSFFSQGPARETEDPKALRNNRSHWTRAACLEKDLF